MIYLLLRFVGFFTPALTDSLSKESKWQQVSSNFQDFSQYFGCSLDGLFLSFDFQIFQVLY